MSENPKKNTKAGRKTRNFGELRKRRIAVLGKLTEGKTVHQIADETGVSISQISSDVKAIKKSAANFLQNAVLENTAYVLSLSLHNVHKVIEKANQIFENTHDERMKIWVCKLVLEATKLQNDTVLQGYNHVSVTESAKLLEYADKMGSMNKKDLEDGKLKLKSYMPPSLKVIENPNQNKPLLEKTNEPEITSGDLNKHVTTNYFYIKDKVNKSQ